MTRVNLLSRRVCMAGFLLFLVYTTSLFAQSLMLFGIDTSAYPTLRAKFYAFDKDGNQLSGIAPGDLQLLEDGVLRTVTRVSCTPGTSLAEHSSVLTIDISGSMAGGRILAAKAAARAWIEALPLGRSECAVTSFEDRAFINQDFTTDRAALLQAVEALRADGGTNFDAALLTPPAGALEVCNRGKNRKVIVFLSDGHGSMQRQSEIIAEALRQNAVIYALILGMHAPQSVREICAATGGLYFEQIMSEAEAAEAYRCILHRAPGSSPCEMEWTSDGCDTSRSLEVTLSGLASTVSVRYRISSSALPKLVYTPSRSLRFGAITPGTRSQQQVTLTVQGSALRIESVTVDNPHFSIIDFGGGAPPFILGAGQSRTLNVEFRPIDSTYAYCHIKVESDACLGTSFYADGGVRDKQASQVTVKVLHPNGGERFIAGSEVELTWKDVMPEENVKLEYSTDGGSSWMSITDETNGLRYAWRVPRMPSDRCLLRVSAASKPTFIEDMVLIPMGTFRMGNITDNPDGYSDEKPVHELIITRPFLMGRTEVTQTQYEAVIGSNPSNFKGADLPVERVNWYDAVEFCNALSRHEGLDPCYSGGGVNIVCDFTANGYRLPTEAEWEYACRAGAETDFHTGDMTIGTGFDPALDRTGWFDGNSNTTTHPVGEKEPNAFGLYDMHGNVWEWCWDWYGSSYYASSPADDPRGPASGSSRVLRGGSFFSNARICRSARRGFGNPSPRNYDFGFRLVRTY